MKPYTPTPEFNDVDIFTLKVVHGGELIHLDKDGLKWEYRCAYMRTYRHIVEPMPSQDQWQRTGDPPLMPPIYHKQPGRPKKSRKKGPDKKPNPNLHKLQRYHTNLSCGNYGQERHTRVNCKATKSSQCQSQPIQNSSQIVEILQGHGETNLNQVADEQQTKKRLKSPVKRNKAPTWLQKQRATIQPWHY
ncbi:hypothetical protein D8674_017630 [Pyrus ussuriensis x Pyrus communis]|uniref:Uncharacterized protein n=1 Tax=Pyrus ussuriensis x Pyrus communis TaxID=2448454 RepID=A0A5N5HKC3_9ROSA|nr:hypothetical protein D8674_017630 [Pyrus ussuriensis x Pyrus communis]